MIRKLPVALAGLALISLSGGPASAHDIHWGGEVRVRYEADDRSFLGNVGYEHGLVQRTRVSGLVTNDDGAEIFIQLQDSRVWGDEGSTLTDTRNLDVHQAFARLTDPYIHGLEWYLGRQELHYGKGRIFSGVDWDNVGRSFDAARARMTFSDDAWFDVAFAKVSEEGVTGVDENVVYGIWHFDVPSAGVVLEPVVLYKENDVANQYLTALGTHGRLENGRLYLATDLVWQTAMEQDAYLASGRIAVDASPGVDGSAGLGAGYSLASGDKPNDPDDMAYDNLYYDYHGYHGWMDLATGIAAAGGASVGSMDAGLQDLSFTGWVTTSAGVKLKGAVHFYETDIRVPSGSGDPHDIGREINFKIMKDLDSGLTATAGGGFFQPGAVTEALFGDENATWFYVQGSAVF